MCVDHQWYWPRTPCLTTTGDHGATTAITDDAIDPIDYV